MVTCSGCGRQNPDDVDPERAVRAALAIRDAARDGGTGFALGRRADAAPPLRVARELLAALGARPSLAEVDLLLEQATALPDAPLTPAGSDPTV